MFKKCRVLHVFGTLVVTGMLALGGMAVPGQATAADGASREIGDKGTDGGTGGTGIENGGAGSVGTAGTPGTPGTDKLDATETGTNFPLGGLLVGRDGGQGGTGGIGGHATPPAPTAHTGGTGGAGGKGGGGNLIISGGQGHLGNVLIGGDGGTGGEGVLSFSDSRIDNKGNFDLGGDGNNSGRGGTGRATFLSGGGWLGETISLGGDGNVALGGDGSLTINNGYFAASKMYLGGVGISAGAGAYLQDGGTVGMYEFTKRDGNASFYLNRDPLHADRAAFIYGDIDLGWQRWNKAVDWVAEHYGEPTAILAVSYAGTDKVHDTLDFSGISTSVGGGTSGANNGLMANSLTIIDGKAYVDNGLTALTLDATQTIDPEAGMLVNADHTLKTGDSFTAVGGAITNKTWTAAKTGSTSRLMTPSQDGTGKVTMVATDKKALMPGLSNDMDHLLGDMAAIDGVHTYTRDATLDDYTGRVGQKFLSRATDIRYVAEGRDSARIVESAARMAAIGAVPQMAWAASSAAGNAVTQRTSLALTDAGLQSMSADGSVRNGASAGDEGKNGFAMWVMPLYQSWNGFGLEGGNLNLDVNGGLGGVAIGADYTFAEAVRAGITFNIGGGYAQGSGDFAETTNNMNFWGVGAYLGWTPGNFGLTADVNYTSTYNKLEQDVPGYMEMADLKSDITAWAISAGLRGEYKLATSVLDIIPHVGVRYTSLNTNKYDVDVRGEGLLYEGEAINQSIWTFPVGVAFSKRIETGSGWHFKPSLDLAVIPAAGDIMARGEVRFTGVTPAEELDTQTMDYITYMGQAGLEFGSENTTLGVNYNIQLGAKSTAHGVFGTVRYEF